MTTDWLYIPQTVHVQHEQASILLFDTISGEYLISKDILLIEIVYQLHEAINMGVIEFTSIFEQNKEVKFVLNKKLLQIHHSLNKPINFLPYLKITRNLEEMQQFKNAEFYTAIYLSQLNIFLTNTINRNHKTFPYSDIQKQILAPLFSGKNRSMDCDLLDRLLTEAEITSVKRINLFISNFEQYLQHPILLDILKKYAYRYHVYVYLHDLDSVYSLTSISDVVLEIITTPTDFQQYIKSNLLPSNITNIHFLIFNKTDLERVESIQNSISSNYNIDLHPIFTEKNRDELKEYIFLTKQDILIKNFTMEKIFRNQKMNSNFFGSLNIYPDGTVRGSTHTASLGNLNKSHLIHLINTELERNTAWRKLRIYGFCKTCLFKFLCPPLSNYEFFLKKYNLCTLKTKV